MIDFIKIYYRDKSIFEPFVTEEKNFKNLYQTLEMHTGELSYPARTKLESMDVVVSGKSGYVKNSIHKLYNVLESGDDHNHNDFTYFMLCDCIDYLSNNLLDINEADITQLEFGLNINVEIPAEIIIKRNVLMYQEKGYNHNRKYYGKGELKQFDRYNYFFKIYDKAKQYGLDQNIIRFELKFIRKKQIQDLGVYSLYDLKNKRILRKLFALLLKRFDELIIVDSIIDYSVLDEKDLNKLNSYKNPEFWEELKVSKSRATKSRKLKDFKRILDKYNLLKTKTTLRNSLIQKYIFLINN